MRFRFRIRTLLILTAIAGVAAAYYQSVLGDVMAERRALQQLEDSGFRVQAGLELINKPPRSSFRKLLEWPVLAWSGDSALCRCQSLSISATAESDQRAGECSLSQLIQQCDVVENLYLDCRIAPLEIASLAKLSRLRGLVLCDRTRVEDRYVGSILKIRSLKSLVVESEQFSMRSYDRLTQAGIEVEHDGLSDFVLRRNYLKLDGEYFEIDPLETLQTLQVRFDKGELFYTVQLATNDNKYASHEVKLDSGWLTLGEPWGPLAGRKAKAIKVSTSENDARLYSYVHFPVTNGRAEIVSQIGNRLRIKGRFGVNRGGVSGQEEFDIELPLESIGFRFPVGDLDSPIGEFDVDRANRWINMHFPDSEFGASRHSASGKWQFLHYPFKQ